MMNKKLNILNIIISVLILVIYTFNLLTKGQELIKSYNVNMLYLGVFVGAIILLFSIFKLMRDSIWMDLLFMIYLLLFIGFNIYGVILGYTWNLYAMFYCYPFWIKYILIGLLVLNIIMFILSFRKENKNE